MRAANVEVSTTAKLLMSLVASATFSLQASAETEPPDYDEAVYHTLLSHDELFADPETVARIRSDLAAIRAEYPEMKHVRVDYPIWLPGELIVCLDEENADRFVNGRHAQLEELNETYGFETYTAQEDEGPGCFLFHFGPLNPERLAPAYREAEGAWYAWAHEPTPPFFVPCGHAPSDLTMETVGRYRFRATSGTACLNQYWIFGVEDGVVELLAHWDGGVPLHSVSWSEIKSHYR